MNKNSQKIKKINIDKVRYLIFIDTETIGQLEIKESCLPFEIGVIVYDNYEKKVVYKKSFIVKRFFNNKYIMLSSFSASKYPKYQELIKNDKSTYFIGSVKDISQKIKSVIKRYNSNIIVAHNGNFDIQALERLFNEFGVYNPFYNMDLLDTMEISTIITNSIEYVKFCKTNKKILNKMGESAFITNSGRVRITAQALTCYLQDNPNYQESHTAIQDILDEIDIFNASLERLGNRIVKLNTSPTWRDYEN